MQNQELSAATIAHIRAKVEAKELRIRARLDRAAAERAENNPIELAQRATRARALARLTTRADTRQRWLAVAEECSRRMARAVAPLGGFTVRPVAPTYLNV